MLWPAKIKQNGQRLLTTHMHMHTYGPLSSSCPQVASLDTSPGTMRHYTSFRTKKCLLGVRNMKFEIDPLYPKKNKNWEDCELM